MKIEHKLIASKLMISLLFSLPVYAKAEGENTVFGSPGPSFLYSNTPSCALETSIMHTPIESNLVRREFIGWADNQGISGYYHWISYDYHYPIKSKNSPPSHWLSDMYLVLLDCVNSNLEPTSQEACSKNPKSSVGLWRKTNSGVYDIAVVVGVNQPEKILKLMENPLNIQYDYDAHALVMKNDSSGYYGEGEGYRFNLIGPFVERPVERHFSDSRKIAKFLTRGQNVNSAWRNEQQRKQTAEREQRVEQQR